MARPHSTVKYKELKVQISVVLPATMQRFLEIEAKRLGEKHKRVIEVSEVVRALITSYYEKRMAGLLIEPDD